MINCEKIADLIVGKIADGRVSYPLVENIGYWVAHKVFSTEAEYKLLTFAHSIIENLKELNEQNRKVRRL